MSYSFGSCNSETVSFLSLCFELRLIGIFSTGEIQDLTVVFTVMVIQLHFMVRTLFTVKGHGRIFNWNLHFECSIWKSWEIFVFLSFCIVGSLVEVFVLGSLVLSGWDQISVHLEDLIAFQTIINTDCECVTG